MRLVGDNPNHCHERQRSSKTGQKRLPGGKVKWVCTDAELTCGVLMTAEIAFRLPVTSWPETMVGVLLSVVVTVTMLLLASFAWVVVATIVCVLFCV